MEKNGPRWNGKWSKMVEKWTKMKWKNGPRWNGKNVPSSTLEEAKARVADFEKKQNALARIVCGSETKIEVEYDAKILEKLDKFENLLKKLNLGKRKFEKFNKIVLEEKNYKNNKLNKKN